MAAERTVDIRIIVNGTQAAVEFRKLATEAELAAAKTGSSFGRTQSKIMATGRAVSGVGRLMTGLGIGLGLVGYVSGKAAVQFQSSMERIHTQAGLAQNKVDAMTKAVLAMGKSGQVQFGPDQLAKALYHIESVSTGVFPALKNTGAAMKALKTSAQLAAVGNTDLEQTTTALMGVLFSSREPLSQMNHYAGLINATVGAGNMTMDDLVTALGRGVVPAFKAVNLSAADAFASVALFADSGIKATSAAAQVSTALHYLVQPSARAQKYLKLIHMDQFQMAKDINSPHGLVTALADLADHLKKLPGGLKGVDAQQVIFSLFPGGRGRIMETLFQNIDRYKGKLGAIYDTQGKFGDSIKRQQHTVYGQLHTALAKINTDLTIFGTTLLPIISKYLPMFTHAIQGVLGFLAKLPKPVKEFLTYATIAFVIGGPIMMGIGAMITLIGRLRAAYILLTGAASGAAAAEEAANGAGGGPGKKGGKGPGFLGKLGRLFGWTAVAGAAIYGLNKYGTPESHASRLRSPSTGRMMYNPRVAPFTHTFGEPMTPGHGFEHLLQGAIGMGTTAGSQFTVKLADNSPIVVHVTTNLDGRVVAHSVLRQTLRKAARGPSGLVGGALAGGVVGPGTH